MHRVSEKVLPVFRLAGTGLAVLLSTPESRSVTAPLISRDLTTLIREAPRKTAEDHEALVALETTLVAAFKLLYSA